MDPQPEVLVADGDTSVRSLLEVIVRRLPANPTVAADGRRALELLVTRSFDAIVMDLLLPEVEGAVLIEYLARERPELLRRVVVVTTSPDHLWKSSRHASSVGAVIRKPFALEELRESLLACCTTSAKS
jgi:CheY-like chemotaxis protein